MKSYDKKPGEVDTSPGMIEDETIPGGANASPGTMKHDAIPDELDTSPDIAEDETIANKVNTSSGTIEREAILSKMDTSPGMIEDETIAGKVDASSENSKHEAISDEGESDVPISDMIPDTAKESVGVMSAFPDEKTEEDANVSSDASRSYEEPLRDPEDEEIAVLLPQKIPVLQSHESMWTTLAFVGIILLGVILRFWGLGDKPLHHDESLHAYFSLQLLHNLQNWSSCFNAPPGTCYHYDPLLHGPFQFHIIAFVYQISQWLHAPDYGVNTTTVRIAAATLGSVIVALPYFLRQQLGRLGAWLACLLLAISPSMVYFSRFAREDIYMACFTLLLVVGTAQYIRTRKAYWLVIAAAAFTLSYATKEATFLTIAIFGSFFGALLVWEFGVSQPLSALVHSAVPTQRNKFIPTTFAPIVLLIYFAILGVLAKIFFGVLKSLSVYITDPKNTPKADTFVNTLKSVTLLLTPWLGILLVLVVFVILLREQLGIMPRPGGHRLAAHVNPQKQPLLHTIVTMYWTHWFFALITAVTIFMLLFTVLFTNINQGIGDGAWQGLYYWLQQQQVARGGQPWYYYFLLIPLYEQIGVVFGIVGVIRSLMQPTRFRLFLAYWFIGNVFIYSWAGEKMPWLMVHMTMPMLLLAAVGLQPVVQRIFDLAKGIIERSLTVQSVVSPSAVPIRKPRSAMSMFSTGSALFGAVAAILLLLPTVQNMYQVTYVHYADAPHEMMIYVQTTTDINIMMTKIDALDKKLYAGKHLLPIGVTDDATWPFAWYMRDYNNVCFKYPTGCPAAANNVAVIITGGDNLQQVQTDYGQNYAFHQYHMRTQWDQGYMAPPCVVSLTNSCTDPQPYVGVGPWLWLSYGNSPPEHAQFDFGQAASNIWQWWWQRKAFGSTNGSYDMGLFIRKEYSEAP